MLAPFGMKHPVFTSKSLLSHFHKHVMPKSNRLYTTLYLQTPKFQKPSIISTNIAITNYINSGQIQAARNLFDEMTERTVVSWNTMISGYSKWGRFNDALSLVQGMHSSDMKPSESTFSSVLSVCANSGSLCVGRQVHGLVLKFGFERFELVGSALLYLYSSCLKIEEAKQVFEELHHCNKLLWNLLLVGYVQCNQLNDAFDLFNMMPNRDVIAWTTLISAYAKSEDSSENEKALALFHQMRVEGDIVPNEFTLDCVLRICGRLGDLKEGMNIHGLVIKSGYQSDVSVSAALIECYCDCEAIDKAIKINDQMENPSKNALITLIDGLIQAGRVDDAEVIFNGLSKVDSVSCNLMIKGYAMNGRVEDSKELFERMPQRTIVSSNTMISVYARSGQIDKALQIFEETKNEENPVTWNSMISGYIQNSQYKEAFELYLTMCGFSIQKTRSTFSALFHACSCLGSLHQGEQFHGQLIKTPFESNVYVGTSLIDMYSRCGRIVEARKSFSSISSPNVAAWTALINAYAHHRLGLVTISLFEQMLEQGLNPNAATYVGILAACAHSGLTNEGMQFFHLMEKHGVEPCFEHYACMVDLLGRSGHVREAEQFVQEMPVEADGVILGALLSACWFWGDMEAAERVAKKLMSMNPKSASAYIILSNIYALSGRWREKWRVRKQLRGLEVKKAPGRSWIELNNGVHVFSVEDRTHPQCNAVYSTLDCIAANINSRVGHDCMLGATDHIDMEFSM